MTYVSADILEALRAARLNKGLSQRDLGQRVGLPQSHISKIEKGGSDLKLSSLIEIARALDLEIKLIPRAAVPAVESIAKAVAAEAVPDATSRALDRIHSAQQIAERLAGASSLHPHLTEFRRRLADLVHFRFDRSRLAALSKALEPIEHVRKRTSQLDLPAEGLGSLARAFAAPIGKSTKSLAALRNRLAHARVEPDDTQLPAYRLGDDDDA